MAEGEVALKRTKHIDAFRKHVGVKYHWIRELVDFGIICFVVKIGSFRSSSQQEQLSSTKPCRAFGAALLSC